MEQYHQLKYQMIIINARLNPYVISSSRRLQQRLNFCSEIEIANCQEKKLSYWFLPTIDK